MSAKINIVQQETWTEREVSSYMKSCIGSGRGGTDVFSSRDQTPQVQHTTKERKEEIEVIEVEIKEKLVS